MSTQVEGQSVSPNDAKPVVSRTAKMLLSAGLIFVGLLAFVGITTITNVQAFWLIADILTVAAIKITIKVIWDYCG